MVATVTRFFFDKQMSRSTDDAALDAALQVLDTREVGLGMYDNNHSPQRFMLCERVRAHQCSMREVFGGICAMCACGRLAD